MSNKYEIWGDINLKLFHHGKIYIKINTDLKRNTGKNNSTIQYSDYPDRYTFFHFGRM